MSLSVAVPVMIAADVALIALVAVRDVTGGAAHPPAARPPRPPRRRSRPPRASARSAERHAEASSAERMAATPQPVRS